MNKIEENKKPFNDQAICGIFINESKQILLVKRTANRTYNPNAYDLMGGDIISGESPTETLLRDAKEKLGLQLNKEVAQLVGAKDIEYPNRAVKTHIFICKVDRVSIKLNSEKYDDWKWVYPEYIEQPPLSPQPLSIKVKNILLSVGILRH